MYDRKNLKNDKLKMFLIQFSEFLGYQKRDLANSLPKILAATQQPLIRLDPVQRSEFNQPYFKDNTKKSKSQVEQKKETIKKQKNKNKRKPKNGGYLLCTQHQQKSQTRMLKI